MTKPQLHFVKPPKNLGDLPVGARQLHFELMEFVETTCGCAFPLWTLGTGAPPEVRCLKCGRYTGDVSWEWWEDLRMNTELASLYNETTHHFRSIQQSNWEVFILDDQKTKTSSVEPDSDLSLMLKTMPGHIVWQTPEGKDHGQFCTHRWILAEDPEPGAIPKARCLLCRGLRELDENELLVIEAAEQAGVVFLKWQDRFEELSALKSRGRKGRRRRRKGTRVSKATGGITSQASVPEGYISVKQAAAQLGLEPKKLRRQLRAGRYPAAKVGGKVYCKID